MRALAKNLVVVVSALALLGCGSDTADKKPAQTTKSAQSQKFVSPKPKPEPAKTITLVATGDILAHTAVNASARANAAGNGYDYTPMFQHVTGAIAAADLAICHLETPLSIDNQGILGGAELVFNGPKEIAQALAAAGYDSCSFASNHTLDQGLAGVQATHTVMQQAQVALAGPHPDPLLAGKPVLLQVKDTQVAHFSYSYTLDNLFEPNTWVPSYAPHFRENLWPALGADGILQQIRQAKAAGAEFVVVSMHWGAEYQTEPTAEQQELAAQLLADDSVDVILDDHVHVIQPCAKINNKHVLYGLGNFLSNQSPRTHSSLKPETQDGLLAQITLTKQGGKVSSKLQFLPTHVDLNGHVIYAVNEQNNPASLERTTATMHTDSSCGAQRLF